MKMTKLIAVLLILINANAAFAQELNVATFNIRYKNNGDKKDGNGWDLRGPVIADLIKFHDFDIFGAQEVLHEQLTDLSIAFRV